jgi:cytochrome c biogenesis protein CcmG/thiol:disulfide interchange protein DsbE
LSRSSKKLCSITLTLALLFLSTLPAQADPARLLHKHAPRFVRAGLDGRRVDLAAFHGTVVLLTFWATWCAPCQVEMPRFIEWETRYGPRGLQILAVSLDDDRDPVRALIAERGVNYPVLMGDVRLARAYGGILGLPVNFLIDRHGKIAAIFQGEIDSASMEDALRGLLDIR